MVGGQRSVIGGHVISRDTVRSHNIPRDARDGDPSRPSSTTLVKCPLEPSQSGRSHVSYEMFSVARG